MSPALALFHAHLADYRAQSAAARRSRVDGDATAVARAAAMAGVALRRLRAVAANINRKE